MFSLSPQRLRMNPGVQIVFMFILKKKMPWYLPPTVIPVTEESSLRNPMIAGSVVLETLVVGRIRGIQFQGIVSEPEGEMLSKAKWAYLKKFPPAVLMNTHLWTVKLTLIKMTDNRLGFGKKLIWP